MQRHSEVRFGNSMPCVAKAKKEKEIEMKRLKVRFTFTEAVLGTASNNREIHSEFIASHAPNAKSRDEEVAAIGVEESIEKSMTVFPRFDDEDTPMFWDYQIKGFFKDTCSSLRRCKNQDYSKESCKMSAFKKVIDGCIFVEPRKIPIDMHGGSIGNLQRPLRGQTAQGERISLANSETVPAGSTIDLTIICLADEHEKAVIEWLNYGKLRGLGQWRNGGYGRYVWDYINDDGRKLSKDD